MTMNFERLELVCPYCKSARTSDTDDFKYLGDDNSKFYRYDCGTKIRQYTDMTDVIYRHGDCVKRCNYSLVLDSRLSEQK